MDEKSYQDARHNERKRASFIESINLKEHPYVKRAEYEKIQQGEEWMFASCGYLFGKPRKAIIKVVPLAFSKLETLPDFLSCIYDHECFHVREFHSTRKGYVQVGLKELVLHFLSEGILQTKTLVRTKLMKESCEAEVRAYSNQLSNANDRGISPAFKEILENRLESYKNAVGSLQHAIF